MVNETRPRKNTVQNPGEVVVVTAIRIMIQTAIPIMIMIVYCVKVD